MQPYAAAESAQANLLAEANWRKSLLSLNVSSPLIDTAMPISKDFDNAKASPFAAQADVKAGRRRAQGVNQLRLHQGDGPRLPAALVGRWSRKGAS